MLEKDEELELESFGIARVMLNGAVSQKAVWQLLQKLSILISPNNSIPCNILKSSVEELPLALCLGGGVVHSECCSGD